MFIIIIVPLQIKTKKKKNPQQKYQVPDIFKTSRAGNFKSLSLKTLPEQCASILFFDPVTKILKLFFAKEFLFSKETKRKITIPNIKVE